MISASKLSKLYHDACDIELQAFKPGNVSVYAEGHDMTIKDFQLSAMASMTPITNPNYSLGEKIYYAVKNTRDRVGCNTNLGIILLCAPLIQALSTMSKGEDFRERLSKVLHATTRSDANWVFKAITLASPGGLGESAEADVHTVAQITLIDAMKIAENKDRVALQYTTNFKDIFDFSILRYNDAFKKWGDLNWSAVASYSALLSKFPDSHIERKYGNKYTEEVQIQMRLLNDILLSTDKPQQHEAMLYEIDTTFKKSGINPGTTADLTVATIFVFLAERMLRTVGL
ncbi:MAG: triphosphoribosyl-dephospho-CoA synthase [Methylococcales bacterium]|nr:triphosphoribosyl-dephospho-CoA synthase [Methylococcales bacterium]